MRRFLVAYEREKSVTNASKAAGIDRTTYWRGKKKDKEFSEAVEALNEQLIDVLEKCALARAIDGYEEVTFERDEVTGEMVETKRIRKFSNSLVIFLLKCRRPHVYNIAPGYIAADASSSDKAEDIRTALAAMDQSLGGVEAEDADE